MKDYKDEKMKSSDNNSFDKNEKLTQETNGQNYSPDYNSEGNEELFIVQLFKKHLERIKISSILHPKRTIIKIIIILNIALLLICTLIIKNLMKDTVGDVGFFKTVYYTVCLMLDAGAIENVISDVGRANVGLVIICIITIIFGMITFTGAAIGYITNIISDYIENAKTYSDKIIISDHIVILNWNNRAVDIINDMLYLNKKEVIIVLVNENAEDIRKEIDERIFLTQRDNKSLKNKLQIIVKEGSTYSSKQLNDISLDQAKSVIILGENDVADVREMDKGNSNTIKTLIQVADITSSEESKDNQQIIVEVEDEWTEDIVNKIISHKEVLNECKIIPVPVNKMLGQLLSQICLFPELNSVYSELMSSKGTSFYSAYINEKSLISEEEENHYIEKTLYTNNDVIPLSFMRSKMGKFLYYMANSEKAFAINEKVKRQDLKVSLNTNYWVEHKNIIIIGHNSKIKALMDGFDSFRGEWNKKNEADIISIMVIDDETSLEQNNYYRDYKYVEKVVGASIYDTEIMQNAINEFVDSREEDTSILILSDDMVPESDLDAYALIVLICVQGIKYTKIENDPSFDKEKMDIIVEILNPKNVDVVRNYDINKDNIVVSNEYVSKIITQMRDRIELYYFFEDILTNDQIDSEEYCSKELYVKKAKDFFDEIPIKSSAFELIRAIYEASPDTNKSFLLGVVSSEGKMELFEGNQEDRVVEIKHDDKLILYSNH